MVSPAVIKIADNGIIGAVGKQIDKTINRFAHGLISALLEQGVPEELVASLVASSLMGEGIATMHFHLLSEMTNPDLTTTYDRVKDLRQKGIEAIDVWVAETVKMHRAEYEEYVDARVGTEEAWAKTQADIQKTFDEVDAQEEKARAEQKNALEAQANELRTEYFALVDVDQPNQAQMDRMVEIAHWFTDNGLPVVVN